jgi:hypothetical protein
MHATEERPAVNLDELKRRSEIASGRATVEAERQVRITLAADWKKDEKPDKRAVPLSWNPGGRNGRKSTIVLLPGKSVLVPLSKAFGWFGPFHVLEQIAAEKDPRKQDRLFTFFEQERDRVLKMYGYPMGERGYRPDMTPTAPHRLPDVTVAIMDPDGVEGPMIRLHEMYEIGAFDKNWPLDAFGVKETAEEVRAKAKAELEAVSARYEAEASALRLQMAEALGMMKVVVAQQTAAPAVAAEPVGA